MHWKTGRLRRRQQMDCSTKKKSWVRRQLSLLGRVLCCRKRGTDGDAAEPSTRVREAGRRGTLPKTDGALDASRSRTKGNRKTAKSSPTKTAQNGREPADVPRVQRKDNATADGSCRDGVTSAVTRPPRSKVGVHSKAVTSNAEKIAQFFAEHGARVYPPIETDRRRHAAHADDADFTTIDRWADVLLAPDLTLVEMPEFDESLLSEPETSRGVPRRWWFWGFKPFSN